MPPVDHDCSLRDIVVTMSNKIAKLEHELGQLKKAHIGPKSERSKMPRVPGKPSTPEQRLAKWRAQAADRAQTETVRIEHKVPAEERTCPSCGNDKLKPIGEGRLPLGHPDGADRHLDADRLHLGRHLGGATTHQDRGREEPAADGGHDAFAAAGHVVEVTWFDGGKAGGGIHGTSTSKVRTRSQLRNNLGSRSGTAMHAGDDLRLPGGA